MDTTKCPVCNEEARIVNTRYGRKIRCDYCDKWWNPEQAPKPTPKPQSGIKPNVAKDVPKPNKNNIADPVNCCTAIAGSLIRAGKEPTDLSAWVDAVIESSKILRQEIENH